jgi:RHS repeat-associated protein
MTITNYYVTYDAMGSVTAILDEDGNTLERRSYEAFGEVTCMLPDGSPVEISPTGVDVGFQGQIRDDVTGLYQMGYRWYATLLGRWLSRDPIGLAGGGNLQGAFGNAASMNVDTYGQMFFVEYVDGKSGKVMKAEGDTAQEFVDVVQRCENGSIRYIRFTGHGSGGMQGLDDRNPSRERIEADGMVNDVTLYGNLKKDESNPTQVSKGISVTKLLRSKMRLRSEIYMDGCCTAKDQACRFKDKKMVGMTNVCELMSERLEGVYVRGHTGPSRDANILNRFIEGYNTELKSRGNVSDEPDKVYYVAPDSRRTNK